MEPPSLTQGDLDHISALVSNASGVRRPPGRYDTKGETLKLLTFVRETVHALQISAAEQTAAQYGDAQVDMMVRDLIHDGLQAAGTWAAGAARIVLATEAIAARANPGDNSIRTEMLYRTLRASTAHMITVLEQLGLLGTEAQDFMSYAGISGHLRLRRTMNAVKRVTQQAQRDITNHMTRTYGE